MKLPSDSVVAVVDGENFHLYRNTGNEEATKLIELPAAVLSVEQSGSGSRHQSSAANPDESRQSEDDFASSVAAYLNKQVLEDKIKQLVIVAAPKTLGELRKHYHKRLADVLIKELAKDLTGHPTADIESSIANA